MIIQSKKQESIGEKNCRNLKDYINTLWNLSHDQKKS